VVHLRLKELLEDRKVTLYWLAEQPGLKYPTLRKMFRGETKGADFNTLDLICKYLPCKLSELIVRDEELKAITAVKGPRKK
jgi:putative transcriptional regulator